MAPYTGQEFGDAARRAVDGDDVAAVVAAASPTPPPSLPSTPSPPPEAALHALPHDWPAAANDYLSVNYHLPGQLVQICGTDDLASVRAVTLRVVSREMSLQRLHVYLPNITTLNLDGSTLTSLRDLGCGLDNLSVLHVARCGLDSLDGLLGLTGLVELHAEDNHVGDVDSCTCLQRVHLIDLRRNEINDISYVQFLSICTELEELSLAGCPVSDVDDYRETVTTYLPQLRTLDGQQVRGPSTEGLPEAAGKGDHGDGDPGVSPRGSDVSSGSSMPASSGGGPASFLPSIWGNFRSSGDCSGGSQSRRTKKLQDKRPSSALEVVKLPKLKSFSTQQKKRPVSATNDVRKLFENHSLGEHRYAKLLKQGRKSVAKSKTTSDLEGRKKIIECNATSSVTGDTKAKQKNITSEDYNNATEQLSSDSSEILEASRRWRALYHAYRANNRAKWEAEEKNAIHEESSTMVNGQTTFPSFT